MKNKKKLNKQAGILSTAILTGTLAGFGIGDLNAGDLLNYDDLGSGAEVRSELIDMNVDVRNSYDGSRIFELSCGEGKCGEDKEANKKKAETKEKGEMKTSKAVKDSTDKTSESKCGEGKCGDDKEAEAVQKESKTSESKCGEGKCG